jgi:hypothetical protein
MSCGKIFCSCCRTAYREGVLDGLEVGFKRGYIEGYSDAAIGLPPLKQFRNEVMEKINEKLLEACNTAPQRYITTSKWEED